VPDKIFFLLLGMVGGILGAVTWERSVDLAALRMVTRANAPVTAEAPAVPFDVRENMKFYKNGAEATGTVSFNGWTCTAQH
jgi:hypothetical protein